MQTEFKPLYFVSSESDSTVLLAMDIRISNDIENTIRWFDSVKERIMHIEKIIDQSPLHFVFQRKSGKNEVYTFVPLTLEIYNREVKNRILIPHNFATEDEMTNAFLETKNNAW